MAQDKNVAEESAILEKGKTIQPEEDLISKVISQTTSKILTELMPYLQNNGAQRTPQEIEKTTKQVKERVINQMNSEYDRVIKENKQFMTRLAQAPKSDYRNIRIPQVYRKYFGSQMVVGLNGSFVTVPIDGRSHRVHKDFYSIIQRKLEYEDNKISHMEQTEFTDVIETDRESLGT